MLVVSCLRRRIDNKDAGPRPIPWHGAKPVRCSDSRGYKHSNYLNGGVSFADRAIPWIDTAGMFHEQ